MLPIFGNNVGILSTQHGLFELSCILGQSSKDFTGWQSMHGMLGDRPELPIHTTVVGTDLKAVQSHIKAQSLTQVNMITPCNDKY